MSHFTEVKTKIKNKENLKKALKKMGYEIVEESAGVQVRGYFGETQAADFKILTKSTYDVGFKCNNEGTYELVGDWELLPKVSGIEKESFTKKLKQEYAHQSILELSEKMGYSIDYINQDEENGTYELSVKQWG